MYNIEYLFSADRVKRRSRLVADEQTRLVDKCLCDAKALAHTSGISLDAMLFVSKSDKL